MLLSVFLLHLPRIDKEGTESPLFLFLQMNKAEKIKTRIEEILSTEFSNTDWFLVEVKILPTKNIQVFIDRDSDFSIADCASINRKLAHQLNEEMDFSSQFGMEVSSPGVGRPLQFPRQYKKNIGRKLSVETADGKKIDGKNCERSGNGGKQSAAVAITTKRRRRPKRSPSRPMTISSAAKVSA